MNYHSARKLVQKDQLANNTKTISIIQLVAMHHSSQAPAQTPGLFDRQRPLHAVLGGGKVADILLWKDRILSAATVAGFCITWFLFEVVEYNFLTLLCHILIAIMLILLVWYKAAGLITWRFPDIYDFEIPESTFTFFYKMLNSFLRKFYDISTGKDLRLFLVAISSLWIMSVIGNYFTSLNLLYIMLLCLVTLPVMYERYGYKVDSLASEGNQEVKRLFNTLDSEVLNKIPRGPVNEKKNI